MIPLTKFKEATMDRKEALRRFKDDLKTFEMMGEENSNCAAMYAIAAGCIEQTLSGSKQPTKTDFHALLELKGFSPEHFGFLSGEEIWRISDILEIDSRDVLSLRNLRNFAVLFYSREKDGETHEEAMRRMDIMSAVCGVIDNALFGLGAEV